jgi:hypothetical protein
VQRLLLRDDWLDEFVQSATAVRAGTSSAFYRAIRRGQFVPLAPGVYLPAHVWERLDVDARFRARIRAAALADGRDPVFCHLSAAAMWRLPMVATWPDRLEVVRHPSGGGRSRSAYVARSTRQAYTCVTVDRVRVTHLARTVADVGRTALLGTAVSMADAALAGRGLALDAPPISLEDLRSELLNGPRSGSARLRCVLELADGRSGSPGESVSRVAMHLLSLPRPVLQHEFRDRRGFIGIVDFWWPEFSLIGEFDGHGKYTREDMLEGRTPAEAVLAEKKREDRLRALGPTVVRWDWSDAISPPRLERKLREAGLR